ncbi:MAG: STAS domain-containing protein [Actinomycetales bacterium]
MAMPQDLLAYRAQRAIVSAFFDGDETLIRLVGEVDLALAESLDVTATEATASGKPVIVDVERVTFIDSTGLAFLSRLAAAGHEIGSAPRIVGASCRVRDTIEIGGLLPVLDLAP